ncbi:MAG: toll/interleukin receptor protein [Mucilaginibacter sp.]|nr:toll/interleukin receptor protein [Mucilaginibacter sp.]
MTKKYDIFISHSKEDNKLAVALCHFMEQNGFRCWMAPRDVQAGKDYAVCIIEGIQSSRIMIVILSEFSNRSPHVRNEVERAFNHQVAILPFRIRDVIPEQSLEYFLSSYHWLDAVDGQAESYFEDLYRHCFALLNSDQTFEPPKPPIDPPKPPKADYIPPVRKKDEEQFKEKPNPVKPQNNKNLIYIGVAVLALILLFLVKPFFDKNVIEFKNNAAAPVYIKLNGKIEAIPSLSSFNYSARKNSRITTKAYSYWTDTKGDTLGRKIYWSIDTVVHADGNFTFPLNVNQGYFFLKVINTSPANINYITVNGDDPQEKDVINIKVPNDGNVYFIGYFRIFTNTKIEIWNTGNYYLKWTNGSNLTFYDNFNQTLTLRYK